MTDPESLKEKGQEQLAPLRAALKALIEEAADACPGDYDMAARLAEDQIWTRREEFAPLIRPMLVRACKDMVREAAARGRSHFRALADRPVEPTTRPPVTAAPAAVDEKNKPAPAPQRAFSKPSAGLAHNAEIIQARAGAEIERIGSLTLPGGKQIMRASRSDLEHASQFYAEHEKTNGRMKRFCNLVMRHVTQGQIVSDVLGAMELLQLMRQARRPA